jgi:short-subunit dehydrogenase
MRERNMKNIALIIGNSDGIGLATTNLLLTKGWQVIGISRSESPVKNPSYRHIIAEVQSDKYRDRLLSILEEEKAIDLCIFCAGIGVWLNKTDMKDELSVFEVNLLGMVKTAALVIPHMVRKDAGHFIGLSSMADELLSAEAPSYHASKAGFSNYLEGLALALKSTNIRITNIRFGFVDTKMAKGEVKPFMMKVERSAQHLIRCIEKQPVRYTAPWIAIPLVKFRKWMLRLQTL